MSVADVFQPPKEVPSASKLSCGMLLFSLYQSIFFLLSSEQGLKKGQNDYKLNHMKKGYLMARCLNR